MQRAAAPHEALRGAATPFDLSGRVALVTGASSGLGEAFACWLAEAGASVACTGRRADKVNALADMLRARGASTVAVSLDVSDEASICSAFDEVEKALGPVDTVICNAGIGHGARSTDAPLDALRKTIDTNLLGVFLTAREGARRMIAAGSRESGRGRIVHIGSITAEQHHTGDAMYAATKAGVAHLARNFAREWVRQGINVNTIQPGWIVTDINREWFARPEGEAAINALPRRRTVPAEALRDALLWLCSDASRYVTGATLTIDDGISL